MTPERQMIAMAVIEGKLPESELTSEEVDEVILAVEQAMMDKLMIEAEERGCTVFCGCEEDTLH